MSSRQENYSKPVHERLRRRIVIGRVLQTNAGEEGEIAKVMNFEVPMFNGNRKSKTLILTGKINVGLDSGNKSRNLHEMIVQRTVTNM